jgi:5-oxoprolinase (ATP-hydrolysing) subunit A
MAGTGARVWLNVDLGELPGEPDELYALAQGANVACGGHAGDDASMERAVALCLANGTALGAHPSYPDREGFGRRAMPMDAGALRRAVAEQCARLAAIARAQGATVGHAKAHGALYHAASADPALAEAVVHGVQDALGHVTIVGPPVGALVLAAERAAMPYAREGFADRATRPDGSLVPRTEPGAVVTDPVAAAARARTLLGGAFDTLCVHGDTPGAVAVARAVRAVLDS